MQLCFNNEYSSPISIAVMWVDVDRCEGDIWATEGWWNINPGESVATDVWTNNRYFYFYAEAEDGAYWAGPYGPVYATYDAFNGCIDSGTGQPDYLDLGMRQIDAGWWYWSYIQYTVNLT